MTLWGIDVHPRFQAGLNIERVRAEGFDFLSCKVSQGTTVYPSQDWLRRGKACGLLTCAYHYLDPGNEESQAQVFTAQLAQARVPGVIDAEAVKQVGDRRVPTLRIENVRRFYAECLKRGAKISFLYLPRWYWSSREFGSPNLAGLPPLWGSSYPSLRAGTVSTLFPAVGADRWASYGGLNIEILQFSETGIVAGQSPVDLNAFRGTRGQLAALFGTPTDTTGDDMPTPADLWNYPLADPYQAPDGTPAQPKPAGSLVAWAATHAAYAKEESIKARAEIAALRIVVNELSTRLNAHTASVANTTPEGMNES